MSNASMVSMRATSENLAAQRADGCQHGLRRDANERDLMRFARAFSLDHDTRALIDAWIDGFEDGMKRDLTPPMSHEDYRRTTGAAL